MEKQSSRLRTWLIVVIVLGILFTCVGTLAGGLVGYGLGRRGASQGIMFRGPMWRDWQQQDGQTPGNRSPRMPVLPMPDEESTPFLNQRMGAMVTKVIAGSPAKTAGIAVGDVILTIDDQSLANAALAGTALADLVATHEPGDRVTLVLWRNGQQRSVAVTLGRNPDLGGETAWLGVGYRMMPGLGGLRQRTD
jgi:membrane-associated protease RseP (regulator of RpoE activity)